MRKHYLIEVLLKNDSIWFFPSNICLRIKNNQPIAFGQESIKLILSHIQIKMIKLIRCAKFKKHSISLISTLHSVFFR